MQLQKTQLFLNTNETCVWKKNKNCDQIQISEESEEKERKEMNVNKVENSGKKISNTNLKSVKRKILTYKVTQFV